MMSRRTLSGFVLLLACLVSSIVVARTWTDTTGDFKVEAELLGVEGGLVRLKKEDGTVLSVPIAKLCTADRTFLKENQPTTTVAVAAPKKGSRDWPQWRGPARDGISPLTGLIDDWSATAPRLLWTASGMGKGYASVAISGGRIYTLGQHDGKEHLSAFKQEDGSHLWSTAVGSGDHSNGTPTVDGNLVYAVGLKGDLVCADTAGGNLVWKKNYGQDFGGRMMSGWGFSESPLVDGDRLICTPGSNQAMMAALDKKTGNLIWKTSFPQGGSRGKDGAGYSSIVISKAGPVKQYVQLVGRGVIGVHAGDGSFLWGYDRIANGTANVPTPVVHGDLVFCSSGYGDGGSALLRMKVTGNKVGPEEVYYRSASELQNHHGGMVQVGDYIYFGHGHNRGLPICVELATGKVMWGPVRGAGSGSAAVAFADGHLYFRYENGLMALIEATPEAYRLKGTFTIASRNGKSWPHPAIADGKLYLRDQDVLHCYSLTR
jgi:outer membrane protein assembly factor BamB